MLINQTLEKLHSMRLTGLAEALTQQLEDPDSLRSQLRGAYRLAD